MGRGRAISELFDSIGRDLNDLFRQRRVRDRLEDALDLVDLVDEAFNGPLRPAPDPVQPPNPAQDAETEAAHTPKLTDDPHCATCPRCAAKDRGTPALNEYGAVYAATARGYAYQAFVCPWHWHDPAGQMIGEWEFEGVRFDGLDWDHCHLYETVHGQEEYLIQDDWGSGGRPIVAEGAESAFNDIIDLARRQRNVVMQHWPEVQLSWVFSSLMTKLYLYQIFLDRNWVPPISADVRPFVREGYGDTN